MSEKSEAQRLADVLMTLFPSREDGERAAAKLRRLHAECNDLARQLNESNERNGRLIAQRDALLEALKRAEPLLIGPILLQARAAIKSAEEGK